MEWHDIKESLPPVNHDVMVTVDCEGEKSVLSNLKFDGRQWTIKVPFIMVFAVFLKSEYITHWMDMPFPADSIICDDLSVTSKRDRTTFDNAEILHVWQENYIRLEGYGIKYFDEPRLLAIGPSDSGRMIYTIGLGATLDDLGDYEKELLEWSNRQRGKKT